MLTGILERLASIISVISIAVVVYGTCIALARFLRLECKRFTKTFDKRDLNLLRADLGIYLLLGLEFLIAADILKTILEPGITELGILAGVVALRTILSFFLNREIKETEEAR